MTVCMRCGREIEEGQVFCQDCLKEMSRYPVDPNTVVQIPLRKESVNGKKNPRRRSTSPEEQILIYSVRGTVIHMEAGCAVIECGGVGYKCQTTINTLKKIKLNSEAMLYTYMNVRDDAVELFGFSSTSELSTFKMLISVSGVGPKAGLAILSELTPEQVAVAVASGDSKTITRAQGVGNKLAQVVYEGKWFTPLCEAIRAFVDVTQEYVTGEVKFKLYKGNIIKAGETSPYSLYSESLASFTTGDMYDHHDADGFITLFGLPLKVRAMKMQELAKENQK